MAQISKNAAIAKSNAEREVAIAEAQNSKAANDAKVAAAEQIAVRNNEFEINTSIPHNQNEASVNVSKKENKKGKKGKGKMQKKEIHIQINLSNTL